MYPTIFYWCYRVRIQLFGCRKGICICGRPAVHLKRYLMASRVHVCFIFIRLYVTLRQ
jgi:hypothetical protein